MAYFENDALKAINTTEVRDLSVAECKNGKLIVVYRVESTRVWYYCHVNDYTVLNMPGWMDSITPVEIPLLDANHNQLIYAFNVGDELYLSASLWKISAPAYNGTYLYKSPSGNGGDWQYFSTVTEYYWATDKTTWDGNDMPGGVYVTDSGRWVLVGCHHGSFSGAMDCRGAIFISDDDGETWTETFTPGSSWGSAGALGYEVVEYDRNLYLLTSYTWGGGGTSLYVSSDEGSTWSSCGSIGGYDYCAALWVGDDGYLYLIRGSQVVWRTNGDPNPVSLVADGGTWELVTTMPGLLSEPDLFGRYSVSDLGGAPIVLLGSYATRSGKALQTCMQYVLVEEVEAGLGSMVYDGKTYRYLETLYQGEITTHPSAGIEITYTYPGATVVYGEQVIAFLASGITDPTAAGGFGSYTADTSRTVQSLADREVFVNFYYIVPSVTVITDSISDESFFGFTVNMEISLSGAGATTISNAGFVWGTENEPTLETAAYVDMGPVVAGSYSPAYSGADILASTTYYVRAYAVTSMGIFYGNELDFEITPELPEITADAVDGVSKTGFTTQLTVTSLGDKSVTFGFIWGPNPSPRLGDGSTEVEVGSMTSPQTVRTDYSETVEVDVQYYLAAYATNSAGTAYSTDLEFILTSNFYWEFIATPDHNRLNNLNYDDHTQYHNDERGDARYIKKTDGAGDISTDPIEGLTGTDVQAILEALKDYIDEASGEIIAPTEASFENEAVWTVNHNLGRFPIVTIWEETSGIVGFGTAPFGTSLFGGAESILTIGDPEAAVVTQQGLNTLVVTWSSPKTGKVVYI